MGIRIKSIAVKRGGPLEKDFNLQPGDLNLVYGPNESGKTCLVEAMISLLFKTGARSGSEWKLRDWDMGGKIVLTGLEDGDTSFTKTGRKLEDYWNDHGRLPTDLARLLVVKGGEAAINDKPGGVGRQVLKNCLSGVGILDRIEKKISKTIRDANIDSGGKIDGKNQGEIKTHNEREKELSKLEELLRETEEGYDSGEIFRLGREKKKLEDGISRLLEAKKFKAFKLEKELEGLKKQLDALPSSNELNQAEHLVITLESKRKETGEVKQEIDELARTEDDLKWAEKAVYVYDQMSRPGKPGRTSLLLYGVTASILLAAAMAMIWPPAAVCAAGLALVLLLAYGYKTKKQIESRVESEELRKLRNEFKKRFGKELADKATLEARFEELKKGHVRAEDRRGQLETLNGEIRECEYEIAAKMANLAASDPESSDRSEAIAGAKKKREDLENKYHHMGKELAGLGGSPGLQDIADPRIDWDRQKYEKLEKERQETQEALEKQLAEKEKLRTRISQETDSTASDWGELIKGLREKRRKVVSRYKDITAEILAKKNVYTALSEMREDENSHIDKGLARKELTGPLRKLTGRYDSIKRTGENLVLCDNTGEYPLDSLSTGAAEQVMMALRTGMASISMGGQTGFLLLDDAFQHTDWQRRKNMVKFCMELAKSGWQLLVFTMDDHIRDLVRQSGRPLQEKFTFSEL